MKDAIIDLQMTLSQFDPDISEFLMTLQLIHPPNVTRISTIADLEAFREHLKMSNNGTLSASTMDKYLRMHSFFCDKVSCDDYSVLTHIFTNLIKLLSH